MRGVLYLLAMLALASAGCTSEETDSAQSTPAAPAIRLGAYDGEQISDTHLLRVYSPWDASQHLSINFPEHCWGSGLPNMGHMSDEPITTPWRYNADSTEAILEKAPRPGVTYRSLAEVDSMAVRLEMVFENKSDSTITDIRAMVCLQPDKMAGFSFQTYQAVYIWINNQPKNIERGTSFDGKMPRDFVVWGMNVDGGPDNRTFNDLGWFHGNRSPGRIVAERAWPPMIAVRHYNNPRLWIATIWNPARMVVANLSSPCLHSDPLPADCPPGETVRAKGLVLFHEGNLDGLLERVRREMELK
jgi:hypothetical protein